jgi:para-nitrobenzyl esterase
MRAEGVRQSRTREPDQHCFFAMVAVKSGSLFATQVTAIPLIMDTVEKVPSMFGDGMAAGQALSWKMSSAWATFARDGVPVAEGLPDWQPFDAQRRLTMVFDYECKLAADPVGSLRRVYSPG